MVVVTVFVGRWQELSVVRAFDSHEWMKPTFVRADFFDMKL